jgi:hypothetical protein
VDTVHQRTSGNPLFVLALIDHWKATSAVVPRADGWRAVADFAELGRGVPESLLPGCIGRDFIETSCCWSGQRRRASSWPAYLGLPSADGGRYGTGAASPAREHLRDAGARGPCGWSRALLHPRLIAKQ